MSNHSYDPDGRTCPECGDEFVLIEQPDWKEYAKHLEAHLT